MTAYWEQLLAGRESISIDEAGAGERYVGARGRLRDVDLFDAEFFDIPAREASILDPQHRLFMECVWHACEDAGLVPGDFPGQIALYASCGVNTYLDWRGRHDATPAERFALQLANIPDSLATRTSYKLNLRGESVAVQSACSSSLVAVHLACRSLQCGDADIAIAGSSNLAIHESIGFEYQDGMIYSSDGHCRAFDANAGGTVEGDGVGAVILRRLADALCEGDHVYGVVLGTAVNNDGAQKIGYTAPSVVGQADVLAAALRDASVDPTTIGYVEAHGTGTYLGDPIELEALNRAYSSSAAEPERRQTTFLGSVKPNIGHAVYSAGIAGFIKTVLAVERGEIPPSINFEIPNPECDFDGGPFRVATARTRWPEEAPRRAAVSSFGIGGTNAHIILESPTEFVRPPASNRTGPCAVVLSARTPQALAELKGRLTHACAGLEYVSVRDVAFTLSTGRRAFECRWAAIVTSVEELVEALRAHDGNVSYGSERSAELERLAAAWVDGESVDWSAIYRGESPRRVPLPTYPFQRQRYWFGDKPGKRQGQTGDSGTVSDDERSDLFRRRWARSEDASPQALPRHAPWIICGDGPLVAALDVELRRSAETAPRRADSEEAFRAVLEEELETAATESARPSRAAGVVCLWPALEIGIENAGVDRADHALALYTRLLALIRVLITKRVETDLWLVSGGAQSVVPSARVSVAAAPLISLCQVVSQENPFIHCHSIDLEFDHKHDPADAAAVLIREVQRSAGLAFDEVAYRDGARWEPRIVPISPPERAPAPNAAAILRERGVYVITGGLGPVGRTLARYLAAECNAKLAIISRRGQPNDREPPSLQSDLVEIARLASDLRLYSADVRDQDELDDAIASIRRDLGPIDGVIHCAGVTASEKLKFVSGSTPQLAREVMSAKVVGVEQLDRAVAGERLDFCAISSSISAILGGLSYGAYAAANRYLDAFAADCHAQGRQSWVSIGWDSWRSDEGTERIPLSGVTDRSLAPPDAALLFHAALQAGGPHVLVSRTALGDRVEELSQLFDGSRAVVDTPGEAAGTLRAAEGAADADKMVEMVAAIFSEILETPVDRDDDFFGLGGDSLLLLDVVDRCVRVFAVQIDAADVFDALTPTALADLIRRRGCEADERAVTSGVRP